MSLDASRQLDELGYVLLPDLMEAGLLGRLRKRIQQLFSSEGDTAGHEFKIEPGARRLANLANKGAVFREIVNHPVVLPLVSHVLGGSIKLSSLNARSANPNWNKPQPLHCDMSALPDEHGAWVCNTIWMLDDFTQQNGALRVVPGSHLSNRLPQDALDDAGAEHPRQQLLTGRAGSVIVMNAHLWHGGMANRTNTSRTAIHVFYCRRDKPQQQYQKALLDAHLQASLSADLRHLLALDDALNDKLAGQSFKRSGFIR